MQDTTPITIPQRRKAKPPPANAPATLSSVSSFGGGTTPEIGSKKHAQIPPRPNIHLHDMDDPTNLTDQVKAALENAQGIRTELFNTDRAEDFSTTQVNNTDNAFAPAFAPDPNTDLQFNSSRRYGANSRRGRKSRKRSTRKSRGRKRSARKTRKSRGRKSRKSRGRKSRKSRGRKSRKSRGRKSRKSRGRKSRKSRGRKSRKSRT